MASIEDTISDYENATINGEEIELASKYNDSFYINETEDDIIYPQDSELADIPLHEETEDTITNLDEYIGTYIKLHNDNSIPVLARVKG